MRIVPRQADEPPGLREAVPFREIPVGPFHDERHDNFILVVGVIDREVEEEARDIHQAVPHGVRNIVDFHAVGIPEIAGVHHAPRMRDDGERALPLNALEQLVPVPLLVRARHERFPEADRQDAGAAPRERAAARAAERHLDPAHDQHRARAALHAFGENAGRVVVGDNEKVQLRKTGGLEDLPGGTGAVVRQVGMGMDDAPELRVPGKGRRLDTLAPQSGERVADRARRRRPGASTQGGHASPQAGGQRGLKQSAAGPHEAKP